MLKMMHTLREREREEEGKNSLQSIASTLALYLLSLSALPPFFLHRINYGFLIFRSNLTIFCESITFINFISFFLIFFALSPSSPFFHRSSRGEMRNENFSRSSSIFFLQPRKLLYIVLHYYCVVVAELKVKNSHLTLNFMSSSSNFIAVQIKRKKREKNQLKHAQIRVLLKSIEHLFLSHLFFPIPIHSRTVDWRVWLANECNKMSESRRRKRRRV